MRTLPFVLAASPLLLTRFAAGAPKPWHLLVDAPKSAKYTVVAIVQPNNRVETHQGVGKGVFDFAVEPVVLYVARHGQPGRVVVQLRHGADVKKAIDTLDGQDMVEMKAGPKPAAPAPR